MVTDGEANIYIMGGYNAIPANGLAVHGSEALVLTVEQSRSLKTLPTHGGR